MALRNPTGARLDLRRTSEIKVWTGATALPGAPLASPATPHAILSATHTGTLPAALVRGDILYANATPLLARLPLGGISGSVVTRDATDVLWSAFALAGTAGQTYTFPAVGGTAALLNATNVFSATQTIAAGLIVAVKRLVVGDSPYTALATDEVLFADTDGGAITVNLPAGVAGTHYKIINCGTSGNAVTVDGNGAEKVYGALTQTLSDGDVIDLHYETTEGWW
jgi:hypothetical protein